MRRQPRPTPFPYTTLFRSPQGRAARDRGPAEPNVETPRGACRSRPAGGAGARAADHPPGEIGRHLEASRRSVQRSEEHTSELQSRRDLVCRLLLEKKKRKV